MFDLYFAGSLAKMDPILLESGCNRLVSQHYDKRTISDWLAYKRSGTSCKLFVDSGAYTAHTKGEFINVDSYITYINENDDNFDVYAQVDKIPGEFRKIKTAEQCRQAPKESWENYLYMRERVKSPDKLLYIFHQNEDFKWLVNCLDAKFDGKLIPYIGISPANDKTSKEKQAWLDTVFQIIRDSKNPNVKTHAFGMTALHLLEMYPFYSADSTTWILVGANGGIMSKHMKFILVSGQRTQNKDHIDHIKDPFIFNYIKDMGFELEQLKTDYSSRIAFNIKYLKDWSMNYKFKGQNCYRKTLF